MDHARRRASKLSEQRHAELDELGMRWYPERMLVASDCGGPFSSGFGLGEAKGEPVDDGRAVPRIAASLFHLRRFGLCPAQSSNGRVGA